MEPISDLIFHFYSTFSLLCSRHKKPQTDVRLEQSISLEMYILEKIISFNNLGNYHIRLSYQAKFHKNPSNDVYLFHFPVFLEWQILIPPLLGTLINLFVNKLNAIISNCLNALVPPHAL